MKKILCSLFVTLSCAIAATPASHPLHAAAKNGDVAEIERLLINKICKVDDRDECEKTALHWAAEYGRVESIKKLMAYDADIEAVSINKNTPLHVTALWGCSECLKELVAQGANVEARNGSAWTPLHYVAWSGNLACVEYLVNDAGADHEAKNVHEQTPKDLAAENGHQDVVNFFESYQGLPTTKGTEI